MRPDITVPHNESSGFFIVPPTGKENSYGTIGAVILDQFKSCRNVEQIGRLFLTRGAQHLVYGRQAQQGLLETIVTHVAKTL